MSWQRTERLDAARLVSALHDESSALLEVEGPCPGGQVGAAYVRWPDGHRSVLRWRPNITLAALYAGPVAIVDALRSIGYPAPAVELAVQLGHAVVTVQELLPGTKIDRFDTRFLDQALALNQLQAHALADHPDVPVAPLYLRTDGPGFCLHEPLRQFNRRTAALERRITALDVEHLSGDDAMHLDFHPGNMLAVDGTITGIIDWDGGGRGDRRFDLVVLRFGLESEPSTREAIARLDAVLDTFPDDVLVPAWAHMSLRMTDWAIRHFTAADVEMWLDVAEQRMA